MSYDKHVVEDYNTVSVTFRVEVIFENKMYNNLIVNVETEGLELKRGHNGFWSRRKTTIVDAIVLVLLLMSFWTYILSTFKAAILAKVCNICDQVCDNQPCPHKLHLVIYSVISPILSKIFSFCKL